ncbi:hypothetical protein JCGZ_25166 [Jatropha curcas]|uniref:Aminotransferase-like plant mobile domain-containing protein n=1 Tax=Jatropha curcas TaxID=180498 RepID=A0A067JXZ5_JATCU|nr:hypothetical protein JCGZ_25166 [Jatropha curcas]
METLGVILDIPVFKGDWIPVSRNALTSEVDLSKARAGGSSTDTSAFLDLLDPPMRSRVITAGFGDYASGLCQTQPRFPPAMRYALMERWNDCTHSFIFGFGEMTLTPADFTAITGLGFDGDAVPLDSRYQTAALGAELDTTLLGVTTCTRYTLQGYVSYEVVYKRYRRPGGSYLRMSGLRPLLTPERRGTKQRAPSDSIGGRCLDNLCPSSPSRGPYPVQSLTSGLLAGPVLSGREGLRDPYRHSPEASAYCSPSPHVHLGWDDSRGQDKKRHRTPAFYGAQTEVDAPAGPMGVVPGDIPFPPGMEVTLDPTLGLGLTLAIPADLRQVPAQRYQELYQMFCFARTYIARLYPEHREMELEIGRLRRHQTRQAAAVSRLQMENDRLCTRLEVEGIPLDFSNEEEYDDDDASSDDAPPPPPSSVRQAAVNPSRRRP